MTRSTVGFGIIGGGLMGREFASAVARWIHLDGASQLVPAIAAVCDPDPSRLSWFERLDPAPRLLTSYTDLLAEEAVDAVYCAVPHHLHAEIFGAVLAAEKHLLGEKPFGIDLPANQQIMAELERHPGLLVRCSSEMPFFPGAQAVARCIREERLGRILEVRSLFHHSSDLDPTKPINWKRRIEFNGAYGCMGDLGMHVFHLPLRMGWVPSNVRAILSDVVTERPDGQGGTVACDTWDNAVLLCEVSEGDYTFPLRAETKRIAPGQANTWVIEVDGMQGSVAFSTKFPKTLRQMTFSPGQPQAWQVIDLGSQSAYPTVTGGIFEFGFSDAILQMWAAFMDELEHGPDGMVGPFGCATPAEAETTHHILTAALESQQGQRVVPLHGGPPGDGA